ncbi:MAG: YhbY family RNA-binding protein [Opitutales bacterium]
MSIALDRDELVKVRVATETREERAGIVAEIADQTNSCMCGATGATACFYRPSKQKLIDLSKEQ